MKNIIMLGNLSYNINLFIQSGLTEGLKYSLEKTTKSLGNILNISIVLSKYGLDVWYFSNVGNDIEGSEIINNLHANKVHSDYVNILNNSKTTKNYIIRNLKNGTKTIICERDNNKYELNRKIDFDVDIIYTESSKFEFAKILKNHLINSKLVITVDKIDEETLNICKYADYIIMPLRYAEILSFIKIDTQNKQTIIDLFTKINNMFNGKIIIYDEMIGSIYQYNNRLNVIPKLGDKYKIKDNNFDVYKSTILYGIANDFNIDKTIKLACISKFLYDNNKMNFNIKEVIDIYEKNN